MHTMHVLLYGGLRYKNKIELAEEYAILTPEVLLDLAAEVVLI